MTKRTEAAHRIRQAIEVGRYRPGQIVSQREIMADLGLSVTPTREALIELVALGVLDATTHTNVRIARADPDELRHLYRLRLDLELPLARNAAAAHDPDVVEALRRANAAMADDVIAGDPDRLAEADRRFHDLLLAASSDRPRRETITYIRNAFVTYAVWSQLERRTASIAEHERIVAAIADRDEGAAEAAYRTHLESGLASALDAAKDEVR